MQEYKVEEAHKQMSTSTPSPPVNSTTTPSSPLQLNMHMISRTNQTSGSKYETAVTGRVHQQSSSRGQAAAVDMGSTRGGLDLLRGGRRGARNRAAVRSGGRGLGSRLRGRSDYSVVVVVVVVVVVEVILVVVVDQGDADWEAG